MDARLHAVAPPAEDMGIVRAREILGSMKQKRESFAVALQSSRQHQHQHGAIPVNPFGDFKQYQQASLASPPFCSEEETEAITKQLNLSLQERRERLSRMTTSCGVDETGFLKVVSIGGSRTSGGGLDKTIILKEAPYNLSGSSHESVCSIATQETLNTTGSGSHLLHDTTESSSPDDSEASTHEYSPSSTSKPPTLDDIREAFVEMPSTTNTEYQAFVSSSDSSSAASSSCSVQEDETRRIQAATVMRPLDEDLKVPPEIRRAGSWNVPSDTQIRDDQDIPSVVRSAASWDSEISVIKPVSSRPPAICLSTKEGRAAYIDSLYAAAKEKMVKPPDSHKGPKQSPSRSPNRNSPRKASSSQMSTSSPSSLSSQDLGSMYSHRANDELPPYIISGIYNVSPPRNQTQRSPGGFRPTAGSSRRERPGNQISVASYSPSPSRSTGSGTSSSDIMDLSVVVKDQEKRRKHLASLKVARTPVPQPDDSDFIFSDDSSFDCSTDSNTSGWVSGESGPRDSFLDDNTDHNTDDEFPEDSFLSLTPTKAKGGKSKVNRKYNDEKSVEPILLPPQVDVSCVTNGGMYCLALASGLTKKTPIHVTVVTKRSVPKGLRLSNDFRCGTNGSHYDLALRSGLDLRVPIPIEEETREDGCWEGRGGLYDLAILSGLQEAMNARTPFTVQIGAPTDDDEDTVASERRTDYECGAGGSLSLVLESGAAYTAVGSMYYMAARSGL